MADIWGEFDLATAQGIDGNLGEGVNLAGLPNRLPKNKNVQAIQQIQDAERARQQARRQGGFATGNPMFNPMAVAQHAGMMGMQQGNALQNMINQTSDAWRDEHDSRVSQLREMRRMEHEKEIERMRLEAMIARLGGGQQRAAGGAPYHQFVSGNRAMIGPGQTNVFPGGSISHG